MPELVEQMYCSQQIVIPPKFPYILKRYCKAAIKTQPYDLLRWSFEYFKALSDHRPPPVKLRLEYPVYSTEGGLTRGCLRVLANQLVGQVVLPLSAVEAAWQGFCLDPEELKRIFCLCEVHMRSDSIHFLRFIAVAGGMLTKSLSHTMILLCETLTKEPDGGSAAICVRDFLSMYKFLARMDASKEVRYLNGYREGHEPPVEEPEVVEEEERVITPESGSEDEYWLISKTDLMKITLVDDNVSQQPALSNKWHRPILGKIQRSPSAERAAEMERENYFREWTEKATQDDDVNKQLHDISIQKMGGAEAKEVKEEVVEEEKEECEIHVFDENGKPLHLEFYGEPIEEIEAEGEQEEHVVEETAEVVEDKVSEKEKIKHFVDECYASRVERIMDLEMTLGVIATYVNRFQTAHYDLGMVAGRQMSVTSGEFIVAHIEKEIMEYINEQIGILPDPDLKKKKAKPHEVAMVRQMVLDWFEDNIHIIAPEVEEVEEEEEPIPDIVVVHAVPGIGPSESDDTIYQFVEYAHDVAKVQSDVFMPRNIRHFMCPPLEKYVAALEELKKLRKPSHP